jgi:hypothetical protein
LIIEKRITDYHSHEVKLQQKLKFERTKKVFLKIGERFKKLELEIDITTLMAFFKYFGLPF